MKEQFNIESNLLANMKKQLIEKEAQLNQIQQELNNSVTKEKELNAMLNQVFLEIESVNQ